MSVCNGTGLWFLSGTPGQPTVWPPPALVKQNGSQRRGSQTQAAPDTPTPTGMKPTRNVHLPTVRIPKRGTQGL